MCDRCVEVLREAQAKAGVEALEALANGEEVPEQPQGSAIPIMAIEMGDKVGIMTNRAGWEALKALMQVAGGMTEIRLDGDE